MELMSLFGSAWKLGEERGHIEMRLGQMQMSICSYFKLNLKTVRKQKIQMFKSVPLSLSLDLSISSSHRHLHVF
jgi:hypothetical protein